MRDKYISFGSVDFKHHAKITRRAAFFSEMERIIPLRFKADIAYSAFALVRVEAT